MGTVQIHDDQLYLPENWINDNVGLSRMMPSRLQEQNSFIGGSRGGRARRAPPHLPGILVFDDILGHIV